MLFLSRLILNPHSKSVQWHLANCHTVHQTLTGAFPARSERDPAFRARVNLLWRLDHTPEGTPVLLVQSTEKPNWDFLSKKSGFLLEELQEENPKTLCLDPFVASFTEGTLLRFRLRVNPTRKLCVNPLESSRRNGPRVPFQTEEDEVAWLDKKGKANGFELLPVMDVFLGAKDIKDVLVFRENRVYGWKKGENDSHVKMTFHSVKFEGLLKVTDRNLFRKALEQGIGSGKAYGFGLLSVVPIKP